MEDLSKKPHLQKLPKKSTSALFWELPQVLRALVSSDPKTRGVAGLFLTSVVAIVALLGLSVHSRLSLWLQLRYKKEAQELLEKRAQTEKGEEERTRLARTLLLGKFSLQLKAQAGFQQLNILNLAYLTITGIFDTVETKQFVEKNLEVAQNQIASNLPVLDREELFSRDGKTALKGVLIRKFNTWLVSGKILDIYVADLTTN